MQLTWILGTQILWKIGLLTSWLNKAGPESVCGVFYELAKQEIKTLRGNGKILKRDTRTRHSKISLKSTSSARTEKLLMMSSQFVD